MKDWKIVVIIAAATLLFISHGMGTRSLWEFDEAKHAQVAKEMIINRDWITPTFNGIPFYNKPILRFGMLSQHVAADDYRRGSSTADDHAEPIFRVMRSAYRDAIKAYLAGATVYVLFQSPQFLIDDGKREM